MENEKTVIALETIVSKIEDLEATLSVLKETQLNDVTEEEFVMKHAPEIYANIQSIDPSGAVRSAIALYKEIQTYRIQKSKERK